MKTTGPKGKVTRGIPPSREQKTFDALLERNEIEKAKLAEMHTQTIIAFAHLCNDTKVLPKTMETALKELVSAENISNTLTAKILGTKKDD